MAGRDLIALPTDDEEGDGAIPAFIDDVRTYFGDEIADKIIDHFGGSRISIASPKRLNKNSQFVQVVGLETAKAISELLLPAETAWVEVIPLRQRQNLTTLRSRIRELLMQDGVSARLIARSCGVSERTVWREKARMKRFGCPVGATISNAEAVGLKSIDLPLQEEPVRLIEVLLLEGFAPSLLRQYLRLSGGFITEVRNKLIKEGKLSLQSSENTENPKENSSCP